MWYQENQQENYSIIQSTWASDLGPQESSSYGVRGVPEVSHPA
jgi:hypothetical protein